MWIAVIGSIGVGKSKITNMIAEKFSCIQVDEKIDQKSFDLFEKNPIDFALSNQLSFISNKFKSQVELQNSERKIVSQRIFHESMIFSECLLDNELMTKKDFDMFSTVFKSMASVLKPPSIVVYLKADTMTTHYRKEMNESRCLFTQDEYIKDLNEKYDKFVSTFGLSTCRG